MALMRLLLLAVMLNAQWSMVNGQITIGGKVYGGGNAGNLSGSTKVTVYAGDLNEVYGGARQADVGGHTFVNIEGPLMTSSSRPSMAAMIFQER